MLVRLKVANGLSDNGITAKRTATIAQAIGEPYDDAEKDMASLKDVLIITDKIELAAEKNKVDINAMFTRHTIWTAGIAFSVVGIMIALKFWP